MIFRGVYDFLSNMYPCSIVVSIENETLCFTSVENAFQGLKSTDIEITKRFQYLNGYDSKREGRRITLRSDWDSVKQNIMLKLLLIKFSDEKLMNKLKAITGEIVEDNTWNDTYWGKCNGYGRNELGKLLMLVRDSKESKKEESKVIRIVNLRNYVAKEGETLIKVDRSSVLGNPFYMEDENKRNEVCIKYDVYFNKIVAKEGKVVLCSDLIEYDVRKALSKVNKEEFMVELRRIYNLAKRGNVALGCWCYPKRCHSETIKKFIDGYLV